MFIFFLAGCIVPICRIQLEQIIVCQGEITNIINFKVSVVQALGYLLIKLFYLCVNHCVREVQSCYVLHSSVSNWSARDWHDPVAYITYYSVCHT